MVQNKQKEAGFKKVFASPTSNVGFMNLFGREGTDDDLKAMLEIIFPDWKISSIKRLEVRHPYPDGGSSTFDVYCVLNDDRRCIVEMQNAGHSGNFAERSMAYSAMGILDQARLKWNYRYDRVYYIALLNFIMFRDEPLPVNTAAMTLQSESHRVVTDSLLQIYIEFPKFAQTSYDGMSLQEKFYTAMRDMHEWERRPEQYMDKELDWLFRHADYNNLSESDKEKYEAEMTTKEDYEGYARQRLEWAYEDGHAAGEAKGRAEGLAEGQSKRNIEIARSLKGEGVSVAIISKTTGISAEEIESL